MYQMELSRGYLNHLLQLQKCFLLVFENLAQMQHFNQKQSERIRDLI